MRNIIRIYKIMLHHWGMLIGGLIFMSGYALFSGISITLIIPLFDDIFTPKTEPVLYHTIQQFLNRAGAEIHLFFSKQGIGTLFHGNWSLLYEQLRLIIHRTDSMQLLITLCAAIVIMMLLKSFFFLIYRTLFVNLRGRTVMAVRNQVYHNYLAQSLAFFHQNKVGDSLVRMINDVNIVGDNFIFNLYKLLTDALLLLVYIRIALLLNARLFVIGIVVMPLFSIGITYIGRKIKKYAGRIQQQSSCLFSNVEETLNSMPIIKAFAKEKHEYEKFSRINFQFFKFWRKAEIYKALGEPLSELNGTLIGVTVLIIGGQQVLDGSNGFSIGQFMTFLVAVFSMMHPIKNITKAYTDIKKAMVSLNRISEIMDMHTEVKEALHPVSKSTFDTAIQLNDVAFSYDGKQQTLADINLTIHKGQRVAFVGSSGSGKTTLIRLLSRLHDRTGGHIFIDNTPIENIRLKDIRHLFGLVTQESILFTDTVANNIAYGAIDTIDQNQIETAAKNAYAHDFIQSLSAQYNTLLHPKGSNLSGGQKQRLCIARAIAGDPPVLIFDEATSALDTESEQKVQDAIEKTTQDKTVIVIAHRLSTVLSCDNIVVLDKGRIIAQGKHQDLMHQCPQYKRMVQLQFQNHGEVNFEN